MRNTNENKELSHHLNSNGSRITGRVVLIIVAAVKTELVLLLIVV